MAAIELPFVPYSEDNAGLPSATTASMGLVSDRFYQLFGVTENDFCIMKGSTDIPPDKCWKDVRQDMVDFAKTLKVLHTTEVRPTCLWTNLHFTHPVTESHDPAECYCQGYWCRDRKLQSVVNVDNLRMMLSDIQTYREHNRGPIMYPVELAKHPAPMVKIPTVNSVVQTVELPFCKYSWSPQTTSANIRVKREWDAKRLINEELRKLFGNGPANDTSISKATMKRILPLAASHTWCQQRQLMKNFVHSLTVTLRPSGRDDNYWTISSIAHRPMEGARFSKTCYCLGEWCGKYRSGRNDLSSIMGLTSMLTGIYRARVDRENEIVTDTEELEESDEEEDEEEQVNRSVPPPPNYPPPSTAGILLIPAVRTVNPRPTKKPRTANAEYNGFLEYYYYGGNTSTSGGKRVPNTSTSGGKRVQVVQSIPLAAGES